MNRLALFFSVLAACFCYADTRCYISVVCEGTNVFYHTSLKQKQPLEYVDEYLATIKRLAGTNLCVHVRSDSEASTKDVFSVLKSCEKNGFYNVIWYYACGDDYDYIPLCIDMRADCEAPGPIIRKKDYIEFKKMKR